jgi:hypothetical protein
VTSAQVNAVIERYVINLKTTGALTELAGEMSALVISSRSSKETRVEDVLQPASFMQFADKLTGLRELWHELLHLVVQSDAYATLLSTTLQRGVLDALLPEATARLPLIESLLEKLRPVIAQRIEPHLSAYLEKLIKHSVKHSEKRLTLALDPEAVRSLVDEVWSEIGPMKLSEAFALVSSRDLEDFVVLGYEFWQKYRKTRYFREISRELVDHFFTKYAQSSVLELLDDLGVSAPMVSAELQTFLPALIEHATASGFLQQRIRAHHEPFYRSDAVAAILARLDR